MRESVTALIVLLLLKIDRFSFSTGTCYKRVMKETEEIQKTIEASSHLQPTDKEVIVLYEEEALPSQSEFVN
ncbi:unnamed protein product, partial [Nesidiocoris tenuis]